jgi:phosphoenolpyruvate carboxykinase (GTP)
LPAASLGKLLSVDVEGWRAEVPLIEKHFAQFGGHLPDGLKDEVKALAHRLEEASKK